MEGHVLDRSRYVSGVAARGAVSERTSVSDVDGRASRADRDTGEAPPDRPGRGAGRGRGQDRSVLRGRSRCVAGVRPQTHAHRHTPARPILGRGLDDHGPQSHGADPRERAGRSGRAQSRTAARPRADRRRVERDSHAGVHLAPSRADREGPRRCRRDWLDPLRRHAAGEGVPDAQRPPVSLHRPRSRCRRADAARSVSRERGRCASADLPRRRRAAESEQPEDRRVSRVQRRHRSDARQRSGDRRRGTGGAGGCRVRRVRGPRRPRARIELARRPGWLELQNRKLSRVSDRHFRTGPDRARVRAGPEVRRADHDRQRRNRAGLRPAAVRA